MRKFFSLMMATLFCVVLWAQAPAGTTLFSENFGGYAANDVPSGSVSSLEGSRVIYGGGSVTYTSVDNGKNITKIYAEALASGNSPELLVGKSGGVFTVAGIPSGNAQEITVSFKQNAQKLTVSLVGTGYSTEYASPKPSAAGEVTFDVTVADGADATFSLIMTAGSSNVRVDDILVTVKTASESAGGGDDPQPTTRTIYLNGGGSSLWNQANAVFFVHAWGGTGVDVKMTLVEGDVYSAAIPSDNTSILFVRMAPGSEAIDWDTKWNQSADQTIPADKDLFTMTDWSNGTWSVYGETPEPPTPVEAAYYLVGSMNNWQAAEDYKFAAAETEGEFILHTTLAENDEIKVIKVEGETTTWYPAVGGNYIVDALHAGEKDIYFRPAGNEAWAEFGGYIWMGENQPAPVADFTQPFTLKFNGTGKSGTDASGAFAADVAAIFDAASAPYVSEVTAVANVYAGRPIADDNSSVKCGSSKAAGSIAFTLAQAIEVDSIIVNATQYGNNAAKITVNGTEFDLTAGNKVPQDSKITPEGAISVITIAQSGTERIYLRNVRVYPKTQGGDTPEQPEEIVLPVVKLAGSLTSWDKPVLMANAEDSLSATLTLDLGIDHYQLKVVSDDNWLTRAGEGDLFTMHREYPHVDHLNLINSGDNIKLITDVEGEYTFTWTYADSSLVVTFPAAPAQPKFYITGNEDIVGEGNPTWGKNGALESFSDTLVMNLAAGFHKFKLITPAEQWLGMEALTDTAYGLFTDEDTNICFNIAEAGEVTVIYNATEFKVEGNFYVAPVAKYYLIGDSAFVVDAGATADKAWTPDAIPSFQDTTVLNLKAGVNYIMRLSLNGTWENHRDFRHLTETAAGLIELPDEFGNHSIGFSLAEAGQVTVIYIPAAEEQPEVFKLIGNFYVAPVPDPTVSVFGTMTNPAWEVEVPFTLSDNKTYASLTVNNIGAGEYAFKFFVNGEWRSNGYTYHRGFPGAAGITENNDANMIFQADQDGEYTFYWYFANDSAAIVYPEYIEPAKEYYAKYADAWEWVKLTEAEGLWLTDTIVYKGIGININDQAADENNLFYSNEEIEGALPIAGAKIKFNDTIRFSFNPADSVVTAVMVAPYVAPVEPDPTVVVYGSMTQPAWEVAIPFELAQDKQSATLFNDNIKAGSYTFKLQVNGAWRSNGATFNRENAAAANITENNDANMTFVADQEGEYTFVWFFENDSLAIIYPEYVEPATPKFYVTGNDALVGEELAWHADAIPSMNDTLELDLQAGVNYLLKVTLNGTWQGENNVKGYNELTEKPEQLSDVGNDHNIGFQLAEAGKVQVVYIAAAEGQAEVFKLMGNFYQSETPVEHTYTVAGNSLAAFGAEWSPKQADNDMVLQEDGTYKWEKEGIELPAGHIEFKVCEDHGWDVSYPASNYVLNIAEVGTYTITITFNPAAATEKVAAEAVKTGSAEVDPTASIKGGWDNWAEETAFQLAEDKLSASAALNLEAGEYTFKMILNGGDWRSNGYTYHREYTSCVGITGNTQADMVLQADVAGQYVITWTFANDSINIAFPELPVEFTCNWDEIAWLGGSNEQIKVCKESDAVSVVNVQNPHWSEATEDGIYMTFPSAAWGEISLPEGKYEVQGAGILVYLSALTQEYNEISIVCQDVEYIITIYNAANAPKPAFYLVGNFNEWTAAEAYRFALNPNNDAEYVLTATLAENDSLKVIRVMEGEETVWYPADAENYVVDAAHAGEKDIYFRPDYQGGEDWYAQCIYVAESAPQGCDWDHIDFIGSAVPELADQFKLCKEGQYPSVINIQNSFGTEAGIYVTFPSAAFGEISMTEGTYAIQGAGMLLYCSAFTDVETEVSIVCDGTPIIFTVYNAEGSAPVVDPTVAVMGSMNDWAAEIPFALSDDKTYASLTVENIGAGEYAFKFIINGEWRSNGYRYHRDFPGAAGITENNDANMVFVADQDGEYTFYWYFANDSAAIVYPAKPEPVLANGYYLVGSMNEWTPAAENLFALNPDNEFEYQLAINLDVNTEIKVVYVENDAIATWYPAEGGNYVIDDHHNGATTVYFRPDGQGGEDWFAGCIYVVPTSTVDITNIDANAPAVKILRDGQILIIKGEKMYNAQGQIVK